jgi:hypothetical protein
MRRRIHACHVRRRIHACHMRRRIHACHVRRRIHACHMRRRIHACHEEEDTYLQCPGARSRNKRGTTVTNKEQPLHARNFGGLAFRV